MREYAYDWPIAQCFFIALQHNIAWINSIAGAWILYSCFVRIKKKKILTDTNTYEEKKIVFLLLNVKEDSF